MSSMRTRRGAVLAVVLLASTLATGCADGPRPTPEPSAARDLAARIDALASSAVDEGPQPGASVAVAKQGKVLLAKGYGLADVAGRVRARANTVYRIGSVTKQFTAAAVMDLAERGRLGVDDEVTRFLPDYPTNGYHLTIRHLLTHTSGIANYTELPQFKSISNEKVPREAVVRLFAGTFDFPPGEQWAYSNSNTTSSV
jgi:D-alanyl-D-alanine carboxypeptidase